MCSFVCLFIHILWNYLKTEDESQTQTVSESQMSTWSPKPCFQIELENEDHHSTKEVKISGRAFGSLYSFWWLYICRFYIQSYSFSLFDRMDGGWEDASGAEQNIAVAQQLTVPTVSARVFCVFMSVHVATKSLDMLYVLPWCFAVCGEPAWQITRSLFWETPSLYARISGDFSSCIVHFIIHFQKKLIVNQSCTRYTWLKTWWWFHKSQMMII